MDGFIENFEKKLETIKDPMEMDLFFIKSFKMLKSLNPELYSGLIDEVSRTLTPMAVKIKREKPKFSDISAHFDILRVISTDKNGQTRNTSMLLMEDVLKKHFSDSIYKDYLKHFLLKDNFMKIIQVYEHINGIKN